MRRGIIIGILLITCLAEIMVYRCTLVNISSLAKTPNDSIFARYFGHSFQGEVVVEEECSDRDGNSLLILKIESDRLTDLCNILDSYYSSIPWIHRPHFFYDISNTDIYNDYKKDNKQKSLYLMESKKEDETDFICGYYMSKNELTKNESKLGAYIMSTNDGWLRLYFRG